MELEFHNLNTKMSHVENEGAVNKKDIRRVEHKLAKVERQNESLVSENLQLKEKLLDFEHQQKRNNLLFEGIGDSPEESDLQCINKLRGVLRNIPGIDVTKFRIDRCYRVDGRYSETTTHRILCTFNWYYDVQCILKHRKLLPKGVFVAEDLPEEWMDRRKVLKPIFNAAKRMESLKKKTKLVRDKLVIDGKIYSAAPVNNISEVSSALDLPATCQRSNSDTILFLGSHFPFSNLYGCTFSVNNIKYNSVEQYIQSQKASLFEDDAAQARIHAESNPYKIKKLGSRIKNFSQERWRRAK